MFRLIALTIALLVVIVDGATIPGLECGPTLLNTQDYYPCVRYVGAWLGTYPNTDCYGPQCVGLAQRYQMMHGHKLQNGSFDRQMRDAMAADIAKECSFTRITGDENQMCMKLVQVAIKAPISGRLDAVGQLYTKEYQQNKGLKPTGVIDPLTFGMIYRDIAKSVGFSVYPMDQPQPARGDDDDDATLTENSLFKQ